VRVTAEGSKKCGEMSDNLDNLGVEAPAPHVGAFWSHPSHLVDGPPGLTSIGAVAPYHQSL
jgi:hypothetical protein